ALTGLREDVGPGVFRARENDRGELAEGVGGRACAPRSGRLLARRVLDAAHELQDLRGGLSRQVGDDEGDEHSAAAAARAASAPRAAHVLDVVAFPFVVQPHAALLRVSGGQVLPSGAPGPIVYSGPPRDRAGRKEEPMLKGFRDFIARGNVVELATAVIIGA